MHPQDCLLLRTSVSLHLKAGVASVSPPANLGLGLLLGTGTHRPETSSFGLATEQVENCQGQQHRLPHVSLPMRLTQRARLQRCADDGSFSFQLHSAEAVGTAPRRCLERRHLERCCCGCTPWLPGGNWQGRVPVGQQGCARSPELQVAVPALGAVPELLSRSFALLLAGAMLDGELSCFPRCVAETRINGVGRKKKQTTTLVASCSAHFHAHMCNNAVVIEMNSRIIFF